MIQLFNRRARIIGRRCKDVKLIFHGLCYPPSVTRHATLAYCAFALLFLLVGPGVVQATPEEADAAFDFALSKILLDEGEYRQAGERLESAIEAVDDDPYLRIEYASFLLDAGQVDRAAEQLDVAQQLAPEDTLIIKAIGNLHLQAARDHEGSFEIARAAFESLRELAPGDIEVMSTLGRIYLSEQRFAEAVAVFRQALTYWPRSRTLHGSLIDALLRVGGGQGAEAEGAIEEFLDVAPDSIRARLTLADLREGRSDAAGAAQVLKDTPKASTGDGELLRRLAMALYGRELFEDALYWLDRSLEVTPDASEDGQLLFLRALLLTAVDRPQEATAALEDLLESDPERADVLELLVRHLFSSAQFQDVADLLEPRLVGELDADRAEMAMLYTEALRRLGRQEEALEWLPRVAQFDELRDRALARQAEALLSLARDSEADAVLTDLTASGELDALMLAAEACQREARFERSVPFLERVVESEDEPLQALFWLAAAYERTGRKQEAEGQFRRFLEVQPDSAPALNYLGYMWAEDGENLDEAVEMVQRAIELDPDNGAYIDSLGWAYYQMGRYEEARVHLERAAELVGEDAVVLEHLGDAYAALGESEQAVEIYRRALILEAENAHQVMTKLRQLDSP